MSSDSETSSGVTLRRRAEHYAQVPWGLLVAPPKQVNSTAKVLYAMLRKYADFGDDPETFVSTSTLAEDMGVTTETVHNSLKQLESFGAIEVERRRGRSSIYGFPIIPDPPKRVRRASSGSREFSATTSREFSDGPAENFRPYLEPENKIQLTETTPHTPPTVSTDVATLDPIDEVFERIWKLWPHHRSGKPKAMIAFRKALKAGVSAELVEAAVLRDCAVWDRWPKSEHQFVPHLTTWLNDSRWDADPPADRYSKPTTRDDIGAALADLRSRRGEPQEGIES